VARCAETGRHRARPKRSAGTPFDNLIEPEPAQINSPDLSIVTGAGDDPRNSAATVEHGRVARERTRNRAARRRQFADDWPPDRLA
jgi:hypothetical protein